ncbi:fibrous sheath-interacting protein 1 [Kryptolebias marmoratus]|uniref:fibrous sheath-interacting protein 1 n=1 Tax=Kryptolebias marmoratus TaxID=37003 RepID=UPI0007F8C398|nr:fibrous sheath-interacting protein 1 [Kryptolebias marmoratus]
MEIFRGSLDDISRSASSEQTGSRVSSVLFYQNNRVCPSTPFQLVVLSNDPVDTQKQSCSQESTNNLTTAKEVLSSDQSHTEAAEDENEDLELQRAYEEMKRLDEILSAEIFKEKEIRRQRKELQAKLWQELLKESSHSESAFEALNTKLFLALEAQTGTAEEENFVPLFETQIPDCEQDGDNLFSEQSENRPDSLTESIEITVGDVEDDPFKGSKSFKSKNKQKDFIKRNIELVGGEVAQVRLTPAEKARLADLLRETEEEEEDSAEGTDRGATWAASVFTDHGYTPKPTDLEQLMEIDSKICRFLPYDEFNSLQSSYTNLSMSQGPGSEVGWKCDRDRQPGEKVLQDIKERREQETRLQKIQQQLEILGLGQEMTNETPDLTEEQLLCLLDECELTESWISDHQRNEATSRDS